MTLKIAVLAPIPSPSVSTARTANPRFLTRALAPYLRSATNSSNHWPVRVFEPCSMAPRLRHGRAIVNTSDLWQVDEGRQPEVRRLAFFSSLLEFGRNERYDRTPDGRFRLRLRDGFVA